MSLQQVRTVCHSVHRLLPYPEHQNWPKNTVGEKGYFFFNISSTRNMAMAPSRVWLLSIVRRIVNCWGKPCVAWVSSYFISLNHLKTKKTHMAECIASLHWRSRQSKRFDSRYGLMWKESVNVLPKVVGFLRVLRFPPTENQHMVCWISRKVTSFPP
jgi:hypothetical protein